MIAGIITGGVAVVAVAAMICGLAFALRSAERARADAEVGRAIAHGQVAIAMADVATWKATAERERRRADALDDVLDDVATDGDAAGARGRVLSRWARGTDVDDPAPDGPDPAEVPTGKAPEGARDRDGLLTPGE